MKDTAAFCERHYVHGFALFGSAARNFAKESDVGLLVDFVPDSKIGFMTLSRMQHGLSGFTQRKKV